MSYNSINACARDEAFVARVIACAADEGVPQPENMAINYLKWPVAADDDIEAAYEFALNSGNPNPGGDDAAITDAMILAAVQPLLADLPLP